MNYNRGDYRRNNKNSGHAGHGSGDQCNVSVYAKNLMEMGIGPEWEKKVKKFVNTCIKDENRQTRNQIRKFYDYILEIDRLLQRNDYENIKKVLIKAKINILYAANRLNKQYIKNLHDFYGEVLKEISFDRIENEREKLEKLVTIFEAIVAYSRG